MTRFDTRFSARFAGFFAATCLILSLPASAHEAPAMTEDAPAPTGPALWKVADEDTTIYLFGTVHALPRDVEWFNGPIGDALAGSDALVTEVIMDAPAQARMQQVVLSTGILPEGENLRNMLDEDQAAVYANALATLNLDPDSFDRFEPWYAALMFSMIPLLQQGYDRDAGVEKVLESRAGPDMTRGELETIEYQLGLFDQLPMDLQIDYMMETAGLVGEIKPMLDAMVGEWLEGDADALAEMMNDDMDNGELLEALLYRRNRAWSEWIDARLDTPGTVFVAVGAGHLAGDMSVQQMLAERGVESVRIQ